MYLEKDNYFIIYFGSYPALLHVCIWKGISVVYLEETRVE
jgi:hypothetical protein